jgi:hypothetical protein
MFRIYHLVAAIGLPLFLAGCGEDTVPPSGPRTASVPASVATASAKSFSRTQIRELGAEALFSSVDPSGCLGTDIFVIGAKQARKEGPGKPSTGPVAIVQVFEFNFCTNELLREIFGETGDATVEAEPRMREASIEATISAFDFVNGVEVQVIVDLAWTGEGDVTSQSDRFRLKGPTALVNFSFKGTTRPALVSGTVSIGGEDVATPAVFADIYRARLGRFERVSTP